MEFGFTEEQEQLRKEIHDFFANELPEDYRPAVMLRGEQREAFAFELQRKGVEKAYPTAGWPKNTVA